MSFKSSMADETPERFTVTPGAALGAFSLFN